MSERKVLRRQHLDEQGRHRGAELELKFGEADFFRHAGSLVSAARGARLTLLF
jgi:hypothetical protein